MDLRVMQLCDFSQLSGISARTFLNRTVNKVDDIGTIN
jgi:hypothetical protein